MKSIKYITMLTVILVAIACFAGWTTIWRILIGIVAIADLILIAKEILHR